MKRIFYILLGLSYLIPIIISLSFKKIYTLINILAIAVLSITLFSYQTQPQILIDIIWIAWILIFNIVTFISYYSSKGKVNLFENKSLMWGLFFTFNVFMAIVRFLFAT